MRSRQFDIFVAHYADAERIDERIARISSVKYHFSTDIGKAEAISVTTNAGHNSWQYAASINGVGRSKAQWIHNSDRTSTHR